MAHGGRRLGAGRKAGSLTKKTTEIAKAAAADGITPLEFMLKVMRDETKELAQRLDMAKAAAPYIHPRLSSVEAKVEGDVGLTVNEIRWTVVDPRTAAP